MVLLLRQHAIEPDHAWAGVRDGRIPYAQSVPAPAQILSHETEEGETRTAIDAGDGRGQSAFELADEEAFPPALRLLSQRLRATRSRASTLRSELSLVPCAQPGRGKPLVHVRSGLSLAGSADTALALEARRCSPGLLAQTNNRLCQSIFESFSLLKRRRFSMRCGARPAFSSPIKPPA